MYTAVTNCGIFVLTPVELIPQSEMCIMNTCISTNVFSPFCIWLLKQLPWYQLNEYVLAIYCTYVTVHV